MEARLLGAISAVQMDCVQEGSSDEEEVALRTLTLAQTLRLSPKILTLTLKGGAKSGGEGGNLKSPRNRVPERMLLGPGGEEEVGYGYSRHQR